MAASFGAGDPLDFTCRQHGCANCMTMTLWEAHEKARFSIDSKPIVDPDREFVGVRVSHPTRTLRLKVTFPLSLAGVQPRVECHRLPKHPIYNIDQWGDAVLDVQDMVIDDEAQAEEKSLRYDPSTRTWTLEVDRPFVGFGYLLTWKVPDVELPGRIAGETRQWQIALLSLGERIENGNY